MDIVVGNLTVRRASQSDAQGINELLKQCGLPGGRMGIGEPFSTQIVCCVWERIIGTITVEQRGKFGWLRSLAVEDSVREMGVGTLLCDCVETHAQKHGVDELYLVTKTTVRFFSKRGYAKMERAMLPDPLHGHPQVVSRCCEDAVTMVKSISPLASAKTVWSSNCHLKKKVSEFAGRSI